jgi:hypothetical protein
MPRYITGNLPQFGALGTATDTQVVRTSTIQLNQIPDKLIVFVRKAMGLQTVNDPDFFLAIKNVSLNFNNSSGILASATTQDLYRYSVENGSNQSWLEFSGLANVFNATTIFTKIFMYYFFIYSSIIYFYRSPTYIIRKYIPSMYIYI